MSKLRSLSTAFWSDPFIEELTPSQKLLFIYLITNDKTNMLGIYENSIRKISFETGIKKDDIEKALTEFEKHGKVKYVDNYVVLVNFMKHQNFNTNMKKSAIDCYNNLPKELKIKGLIVSKDKPIEGFESLLKGYGMVPKVEVEYEGEVEYEKEPKLNTPSLQKVVNENIPSLDEFILHIESKYKELKKDFEPYRFAATNKYETWKSDGWKDGHKKPIKNWKLKANTAIQYFKPIYNAKSNTPKSRDEINRETNDAREREIVDKLRGQDAGSSEEVGSKPSETGYQEYSDWTDVP